MVIRNILTITTVNASVADTLRRANATTEPIGKFIVLLLLAFSIVLWAVAGLKILQFWRSTWNNRRFLAEFNAVSNDFQLAHERAQENRSSPLASIFSEVYRELRALARPETGKLAMTPGMVDLVQRAADRQIALLVSQMDRYISILGTIAHISPLLGLFGTVWGVLVAFTDMGVAGTTDLTVVAPGIAGALITTVSGLAAAIPAAICHNYLNRRVERQLEEMEDFASRLTSYLDRSILRRAGRQQQQEQ